MSSIKIGLFLVVAIVAVSSVVADNTSSLNNQVKDLLSVAADQGHENVGQRRARQFYGHPGFGGIGGFVGGGGFGGGLKYKEKYAVRYKYGFKKQFAGVGGVGGFGGVGGIGGIGGVGGFGGFYG